MNCHVCGGFLDKNDRVLLLRNFRDRPVAHYDCVVAKYEKWIAHEKWVGYRSRDNPWRASLPREYFKQKEKEEQEEWERKEISEMLKVVHAMGKCPRCNKTVLDTEPFDFRPWKGKRRPVHHKCLKPERDLSSFFKSSETCNTVGTP